MTKGHLKKLYVSAEQENCRLRDLISRLNLRQDERVSLQTEIVRLRVLVDAQQVMLEALSKPAVLPLPVDA